MNGQKQVGFDFRGGRLERVASGMGRSMEGLA